MTLIIGALCCDGIVLGSDSIASSQLIRTTVHKLSIIDDEVIVGLAGNPHIGMRIVDVLRREWPALRTHQTIAALSPDLRTRVWQQVLLQETQLAAQLHALGRLNAQQQSICAPVIALPAPGGRNGALLALDPAGGVSDASENCPYFASGSGQVQADPFMEFLRRVFWPKEGLPDLATGIRTVCWSLDHAIATNPGGVGDPIEMAILSSGGPGGPMRARMLSTAEVGEHRQLFGEVQDQMRAHVEASRDDDVPATTDPGTPIPEPPSAP